MQRDVLLSSSTVREAITLSALLKLPHTMTQEQKLACVDETLAELVRGLLVAGGVCASALHQEY